MKLRQIYRAVAGIPADGQLPEYLLQNYMENG